MPTYSFSDTNQTFTGTGSSDTLTFSNSGGTFDWRNFSFIHLYNDDLLIFADNGYTITITDHFASNTNRIEFLNFGAGSTPIDDLTGNGGLTVDVMEEDAFGNHTSATGTSGTDLILGGIGFQSYDADPNNAEDAVVGGGDGNDTIVANYLLYVFAGNGEDTIYSRARVTFAGDDNDTVYVSTAVMGWLENMSVYGEGGDDDIHGNDLDDHYLSGDQGNDHIYGYDGNDSLIGGSGIDYLYGGDGDDSLNGDGGDYPPPDNTDDDVGDFLYGGAGNDYIFTGSGEDEVYGGDGNDHIVASDALYGYAGNKLLYGEDGDDQIGDGADDDYISGGNGDDTVYATYGGNNEIHGDDGSDEIFVTVGYDETTYSYGEAGNDIMGFDGRFTISPPNYKYYGTMYIEGGAGNDTYRTGGTFPYVQDIGFTYIYDVSGTNEVLEIYDAPTYWNIAADGSDLVITYSNYTGEFRIVDHFILGHHFESIDFVGYSTTISLIENVTGTSPYTATSGTSPVGSTNNIVSGDSSGNTILAGAGIDTVYGNEGSDILAGGADNDTILGGSDGDIIYGEEGDDLIYGQDGIDLIYGDLDGTEAYSGNDTIYGGDSNDWIEGGKGDDILSGDNGIDVIYGQDGVDIISGGNDGDYLAGGADNDYLSGDDGADTLYGEAGRDTFIFTGETAFNNTDTIADYTNGGSGDYINIADVLSDFGYSGTLSDWVATRNAGGDTYLQVDRDGTGVGYTMADILIIDNQTLSLANLTANGNLIIS